MVGQIPYLVYTIVAGNKDNFSPSLTDLLSLDFSRCKAIFFHLTTHGQGTTASAATVVVITLVFHGPEILGEKFRQTPVFLSQAAIANNVARILHGCRLLYFVL
jgi:hypothetical protein